MRFTSAHFGEVEVDESQVVEFPAGIPGLEEERRFAIFPVAEGKPFFYLHSLANPHLCLVVAEPFTFFPDYEVDVPPEVLQGLGVEEGQEAQAPLAVFVILTISGSLREATANLLGPVIVNTATRRGLQYVPPQSPYTTKHRLFDGDAPARSQAG
ncbi:MAG: flagellar assembly protein FliW [Syntrophomonadaceae bacterium]|nr:flagellar assembly protein FliW [Syntrophomonadaceae bacterium]MDH7497732.1 flagellar assembly protein FliW [Syntrophomonadaceae bacterium]